MGAPDTAKSSNGLPNSRPNPSGAAERTTAAIALAALELDPRALSFRAEIESCLEQRQSLVDAQRDLPAVERLCETIRRDIDRELADLRPDWGHDELRLFAVDLATREALDHVAKKAAAINIDAEGLQSRREADRARFEEIEQELAALGEPPDVSVLEAALAGGADYQTDKKQLETAETELARIERQLAARVRKLTPPLPGDAAGPERLPVARLETIAQFERDFMELVKRRDSLRQAIDAEEESRRDLEEKLAQRGTDGPTPTREELTRRATSAIAPGKRFAGGWNPGPEAAAATMPAPPRRPDKACYSRATRRRARPRLAMLLGRSRP